MPVIRTETMQFDAAVPVVVVGAGACGMTAALAAADGGAEVMVLERDGTPRGTTAMSQGFICAAGSRAQRDAGVDDTPEAFFQDIMAKTHGQTDPELARAVAYAAGPTVDWLVDRHAIPLSVEPAWRGDFGHTKPRLHGVPSRTGEALLGSLLQAAERAGVGLTTSAHVTDVYADRADRVLGIGLERPDGTRETLGCDALVLATCGFGANRDMVRRFIPDMADSPYFGHEGDDGEGIQWGMALGAGTADMGAFQGYGALSREAGLLVNYNLIMEGGIQVNALGERFSNELEDISGQSKKVLAQPGGVAWVIWDERLHQSNSRWHEYQQLTALNMTRTAPTASALAALLGLPADLLEATIRQVHDSASGCLPDPFGRDFGPYPPLAPPFHGTKVTGALFHTQGGLVVDGQARVRRQDGSPLPNLFAGGGTARSISGPGVWGYLPAAGLCMAVTLGRLAGENAARLVRGARGGMTDTLGWRKKFGVIVPSTNTAVQPEYDMMRPRGVTNHFARMSIPNDPIRNDDDFNLLMQRIKAVTMDAVDQVITCEPDAIILGMSAETFWDGLEGSQQLDARIRERSGKHVSLGSDACRAALARYGNIRRVSVVTPYMPVGDANVHKFFTDCGFEVARIKGLKCASPVLIAHVTETELRDAILEVDGPDVDAIVQVGTNLAMARLAAFAELWLAKPVIAINTATYWWALRQNDIEDKVDGFGRLLAEF